jgi:hypothetical protein
VVVQPALEHPAAMQMSSIDAAAYPLSANTVSAACAMLSRAIAERMACRFAVVISPM